MAAYIAYGHAENAAEAADALAALGETFAVREMWRPALDAYKASLDTRTEPGVERVYADLRARYGFRVLDYRVESDFARAADLLRLLRAADAAGRPDALRGGSPAPLARVTGEGNELCVDGIVHGETYRRSCCARASPRPWARRLERAGATTRSTCATARPRPAFTGRNYVLPRLGQEGIPIVSTNTDAVAVAIYRIGDRNLFCRRALRGVPRPALQLDRGGDRRRARRADLAGRARRRDGAQRRRRDGLSGFRGGRGAGARRLRDDRAR